LETGKWAHASGFLRLGFQAKRRFLLVLSFYINGNAIDTAAAMVEGPWTTGRSTCRAL
jgi:hypothetical protein